MCFFFQFDYVVDYIDRFSYVALSLYLWDGHGRCFFDMFLDLFCPYFIDNFCINVHEGDWSAILFLSCIFVWFWYQGGCSLIKSFGIFVLFLLCRKNFKILVLALLWYSGRILCWNHRILGSFVFGRLLMATSISLGVLILFMLFIWY